MDLKDLKEKIYKPGQEDELNERLEGPESFRPGRESKKAQITDWSDSTGGMSPGKKKYLTIGIVLAVVVFFAMAGWFYWQGRNAFDQDRVGLEISGPEKVISGEKVKYIVEYRNRTRLPLENIELVFYYPEGTMLDGPDELTVVFNLDDLLAGSSDKIELPARIIGLKGESKKAQAEISYQPGGITSSFSQRVEFSTEIISVPLVLDFDLPQKLVSGQSFDFSVKYLNQTEISYDDLELRLEYPSGFVFESAQPAAKKNDRVWDLGKLMPDQEGEIFIKGDINGQDGESKSFKVQLGFVDEGEFVVFAEAADALVIYSSPLVVSQTVNDEVDYVARAGDKLKFKIDYQNTTDVGMREVIITAKLEGKVLDLTSLELEEGSFDGGSKTITWRASNLSDLEYLGPREKGQIDFAVEVKDPLPVSTYADKNFIITNVVNIDSAKAPPSLEDIKVSSQNIIEVKVASELTLHAQGYFSDDTFLNSGPIPPKVGQATTYTIKWQLVNTVNDLENVKVEAYLPPHVQFKNKISPSGAGLTYNPGTGQIVWDVGALPAATSILLPVKQVAFQVAIIPDLAHLGDSVELIGESTAMGQDGFADIPLSSVDKPVDTTLPDDTTIGRKDGVVVD